MKNSLTLLLIFISSWSVGQQCNPADLDSSGNTNTADLLMFLTWFDNCPDQALYPAWSDYVQDLYGGGNGFDFIPVTDLDTSGIEVTWTIGNHSRTMTDLKFESLLYPDGMPLDCQGFFWVTVDAELNGCVYSRTMLGHATYNSQWANPPFCETLLPDSTVVDLAVFNEHNASMFSGPFVVSSECGD